MTVIVNVWRGKLPQSTAYNAIFGLNVGHASMLVFDDENPEDEIYISHRPQVIENSSNSRSKLNNIDTSKHYLGDSFTQKAEWISFNKDCDKRYRKPDSQIKILGLNEARIREFYKWYLNNDLPEDESQYHILKNNCSTVVAYFLRKGLECSVEKGCTFCSAERNQPDYKRQQFLISILRNLGLGGLIKFLEKNSKIIALLGFFIVSVAVAFLFVRYALSNSLLSRTLLNLSQPLMNFISGNRTAVRLLTVLAVPLAYLISLPLNLFIKFFKEINIESHLINSNNKFWSPRTIEHFAKQVEKSINKKCQLKL